MAMAAAEVALAGLNHMGDMVTKAEGMVRPRAAEAVEGVRAGTAVMGEVEEVVVAVVTTTTKAAATTAAAVGTTILVAGTTREATMQVATTAMAATGHLQPTATVRTLTADMGEVMLEVDKVMVTRVAVITTVDAVAADAGELCFR